MQTARTRLLIEGAMPLVLHPHVHLRFNELRQKWAVLAPEHVYWPDDISVAILQKLDGIRSVSTIISELADEYDAPVTEISNDVREFLQNWADERLIGVKV